MIFLVYKTWVNTSNNHAGMKYMCQRLEELYPEKYKAIEILIDKDKAHRRNIFSRVIKYIFRPINSHVKASKLYRFGRNLNLSDSDIVVLTEYMDNNVGFIHLADSIKKRNRNVRVFGISHLVPSKLDSQFDHNTLQNWANLTDGIITLGSSLTKYYLHNGIKPDRILTTFHYVDDFYLSNRLNQESTFKILVQGNQMRDLDTLREVIRNLPHIDFLVCQGLLDLSKQLDFPNVTLLPFLEEENLRQLMYDCPVSLNIMEDTIGSNVIVTSLGMGQAMICTDVGSIRDYCNDSNCIFCKSVDDYINAISELSHNPERLSKMREASLLLSKKYHIEVFEKELYNYIAT